MTGDWNAIISYLRLLNALRRTAKWTLAATTHLEVSETIHFGPDE